MTRTITSRLNNNVCDDGVVPVEEVYEIHEGDAVLLERGVGDSCSSGRTPTLSSLQVVGNESALLLDEQPLTLESPCLIQQQQQQQRQNSSCSHIGERPLPDSCRASDKMAILTERHRHNESGNCIDESTLASNLHYRRCLSGDIRATSSSNIVGETIAQVGNDCVAFSPVSVVGDEAVQSSQRRHQQQQLSTSHEQDETEKEQGEQEEEDSQGLMERSKSFDRRLSEAAQFAAAVGELPPAHQSELQVIIDEEESDDDDSDSEAPCIDSQETSEATRALVTVVEPRPSHQWPLFFPHKQQQQHSTNCNNNTTPNLTPTKPLFLHKLPEETPTPDFVYRGICANPPEITKRGVSRGNYALLHRKAWLEVSDKYHRYGKNLRLYYRYWERLEYPTNKFFDWLDSKGEAAGQPLPELEECPRSKLDSDTVLYVTNPQVTEGYTLTVAPLKDGHGLVCDVYGQPVKTGPEGWIFVLRDGTLYGARKITSVAGRSKERFHHSSFFGGKAVAAAGILITNDEGMLTRLYPHSGHYRPGEADMQRMLFYLHHHGVDLRGFEMDTQQILHVTRQTSPNESTKKKKTQSLHLKPAVFVACFLAHKARFIGNGVFDQIHVLRKANVTKVSEALNVVDEGGVWKRGW